MKYVVMYETAEDGLPLARIHFPAHKVRVDEFAARGELLMVGTWANPQEGSMAVFRTREAAEAFVKEDPFILNGVIKNWLVREWNESLVP
jgi:hypothetical protein